MNLSDIPLFSMLRSRMGHLGERQRLIAQNVANSDTPGYVAHDLALPKDFASAMTARPVTLARTQAGHIAPPSLAARYSAVEAPDSETTLDGNSVVVEEQMLKMTESRMAYEAAIGFYQKSMTLLRMAARPPGR
ncbi:MAG TPA: flagellar biosynthesis protein FlgB [Brevundimonas sp.]|nr:flagellar biosynthesis protein FlgB [Brevundimonas sp.]